MSNNKGKTNKGIYIFANILIYAALLILLLIFAPVIKEETEYNFNVTRQTIGKALNLGAIEPKPVGPPNKDFSIVVPKIRAAAPVIANVNSQNSGEYLLGHDFDFVNFDEVAYETNPEYVIEQVLMMRLADREGILDYTSTPKGKNWFYQKCLKLQQNPKWGYVQNGSCLQNNFISKEYVEQKMQSLSQPKINQNILGQFVEEEIAVAPLQPHLVIVEHQQGHLLHYNLVVDEIHIGH